MSWWLSKSGVVLMAQVNRRWPDRDHASDGTIGDAAHMQRQSDHDPDYSSTPPGVVRAIDIDSDLGGPHAAQRLANQLIACARLGEDAGRLSYVIFDGHIASGTYPTTYWKWRPYTGSDPHTNHIHVSFTSAGDQSGTEFPLPIFSERVKRRLGRRIARLTARIKALLGRRRRAQRRLDDLVN